MPTDLNRDRSRLPQRRLSSFGNDVDPSAFAVEHDVSIDQSEQSVIFALSDAFAWVPFVANLANKNVAGDDFFATELFYATTLCVGIATVPTGTLSLFVGHFSVLISIFCEFLGFCESQILSVDPQIIKSLYKTNFAEIRLPVLGLEFHDIPLVGVGKSPLGAGNQCFYGGIG